MRSSEIDITIEEAEEFICRYAETFGGISTVLSVREADVCDVE